MIVVSAMTREPGYCGASALIAMFSEGVGETPRRNLASGGGG
jgi:hypothetical protein